jgi:hypothetical protein
VGALAGGDERMRGNTAMSVRRLFDRMIKNLQALLLENGACQPGLVELNIYQQSGMLGYSVGIPRGALQQSFERGTPIRWVKSLTDQPIEVEKTSAFLADLLDVDFIQAKQSGTVWPFVFKL